MVTLVVGVLAGCGQPQEPAAASASATAAPEGAEEAPAAPYTAPAAATDTAAPQEPAQPVAVDLPEEFPPGFPMPPGGVVTQATAEHDEGSVQASAVVASRDGVQPLFAWYQTALGRAGWNIEHEEPRANGRTLHAVRGDSTADVVVTPDEEHAGWTAAALSIYWSQGKERR